mgnify:CR=1 FL=1
MSYAEDLLSGKETLADLYQLSAAELYAVAQIGYNFIQNNYWEEAICIFEGLNVLNPRDPYFSATLSSLYLREGKWNEAILYSTKAIEDLPEALFAFVNRGKAYLMIGDKKAAVADFMHVINHIKEKNSELKEYVLSMLEMTEGI